MQKDVTDVGNIMRQKFQFRIENILLQKNLRSLGAGTLDLCKDCQEKLNIFAEETRK